MGAKGHPKTPGSGRKKGAYSTAARLREDLDRKGIDPLERFLEAVTWALPENQAALWLKIMDFIYVKPKVEVSVDTMPDSLLAEAIKKRLEEK